MNIRPDQSLPLAILTALIGGFRVIRRGPPTIRVKRNRLAPPGLFDPKGPQPKRRNPTEFLVGFGDMRLSVCGRSVHQAVREYAKELRLIYADPSLMQELRHSARPIRWDDEPVAKAA